MADTPAFARTGVSDPNGKCTEDLKTAVPESVKDDFARIASPRTPAELLREVVNGYLYGQVPAELRDIVWERAQAETQNEFLLKLMHRSIYGVVHESIIEQLSSSKQFGKGA